MLPYPCASLASIRNFGPTLPADPRPAGPVWLTPFFSQPSVLPRPQLLSFDNHLDCLCSEAPFRHSVAAHLLFPSLFCRARQLISLFLNSFRTLYKNTGVYPFGHVCSPLSRVTTAPVYNRVSSTEAFS